MEHEELLAAINKEIDEAAWTKDYYPFKALQALRAVIVFHKPDRPKNAVCAACQDETLDDYPCQTIKAIQAYFP